MSDAGKLQSAPACGCERKAPQLLPHHAFTLALVGNPNAGKTTLFNALTGLRAKTANFPGTTTERRVGRTKIGGRQVVWWICPGFTGWKAPRRRKNLPATPCADGSPGIPPRTRRWSSWTRRISNGIFFSPASFWSWTAPSSWR